MKKLLTFLLAFCLVLPIGFSLACKTPVTTAEEGKVMSVSLNPQIEFVLDKEDKVVSVTALNEDGNHVIYLYIDTETALSQFEGLNAKEALQLFLEIAKENGYLITGDQETISIKISGEATDLINSVKDKADKFLADNEIDAEVITGEISKDEIAEKVKECMKEHSLEDLKQKSHKDLVEMLKESRKETSKIFDQELKEVYYKLREEKINMAELNAILSSLNEIAIENPIISSFIESVTTLNSKLEELKTTINDNLIATDSAFNLAKQAYIEAKKALLDKRLELCKNGITEEEKLILESFEQEVETAKTQLENARANAETVIAPIQAEIDGIYQTIVSAFAQIKTLLENLDIEIADIENAKEQVKTHFKNHFESHEEFGDFVGHENCHWGNKHQQKPFPNSQTSSASQSQSSTVSSSSLV